MSSTREIQPSDAEIEALAAKIRDLPSKHLKSTLQTLLSLIGSSDNASPIEILREWLSRAELNKQIVKINASETTIPQILSVFGLKFNKSHEWALVEGSLVNVPSMLQQNLRDLRYALYYTYSEATCRIAVGIMLVQCRKYLHDKHESAETEVNVPSTPTRAIVNIVTAQSMQHVMLFPEAPLSVKMPTKSVPNSKFLVTGRADWALGYGTAGDEGALLIAMEAKQRTEFSKGEPQLIAYLAILRENRLRAKKTNITTQGFYSDGTRFAFICITADGIIEKSAVFDTDFGSHLKIVFNFIITMMETAMKSTPNATLTEPGQQREKEVNHFKDEVWTKVYAQMDETIALCVEADMEDAT